MKPAVLLHPIKRILLISAGLAIMLTGCPGRTVLISHGPVNPDALSVRELIRLNRASQPHLQYMKAITTLNLESPRSSSQVTGHIALKYPDSVYVKLEGIFGIDGLLASINRDSFVVYNIINKYVIMGRTDSSGIRKAFDYEVTFDELIEALTGLVFISESDTQNVIGYDADSCYYRVTFKEPHGYRKVWMDPALQYAVVKIEHYSRADEIVLKKEFSRFEKIQNFYVPRYVRILRPAEKDLLSIYFNERIFNKKFSSRLFHIHYPKHIEVIQNKP